MKTKKNHLSKKTSNGFYIHLKNISHIPIGFMFMIHLAMFIITFSNSHAQPLNYDVLKGGNYVGKIHMNCVQTNDRMNYSFDSDVGISFILTFNITTHSTVVFEKNLMLQSKVLQKINGREKINNQTAWNGKLYVLKQSGEDNKIINGNITFSTACLYYTEPQNIHNVYSESLQTILPLKALTNHRYVLELPGGNETYYQYTNGICTMVEAHTDFAVIKFQLDESSMLANNLTKK